MRWRYSAHTRSDTQEQLGLKNGVLFGVPIPEQYQAIGENLQEAVEQAVRESEENGVSKLGKEATPWLLKRVGELTAGKSLASSEFTLIVVCVSILNGRIDVALIENTALVGMQHLGQLPFIY